MIQVQTFGAVELRRDGLEVRSVLSQPKRLALFVHLLLGSPSGYLNRDALLARFWPEADDERARNSLRQALHYLRRSLGEQVIENRGDEIGCLSGAVECDALLFERALQEGRLEDAMQAYRGDFLPAFFVDDAPEIESWIDARRTWYRREAVRTASALADREAGAGELRAAALWARQACAIEPHDEAAARRLIQILARGGETAAALAAFDDLEARLRRDHEIDPSEETRALVASIRAGAAPSSLAPAAQPPAARAAPQAPAAHAAVPTGRSKPVEVLAAPASRRLLRLRPLHVGAAAVLVLMVALAAWYPTLRAAPEGAPAVAVLPFANLSGDAANDYLSDGMAEEVLSVLTRVPGLKVAARSSSFSFRGKDVPVDSVGRALRVTHVVEGSVRVTGARVRIGVQLVEAASGYHAWSETYDRDASDILAVQDEISRSIARALQLRLSPAIALPSAGETKDPGAYRLLLRANQTMRGGSTREALGEARVLLEEALRRDPAYARALAALANVLSWQAVFRYVDADSGYTRARELATRALAVTPTIEAHLVLARDAEMAGWDTAAADAHYRQALEINPLDPRTLQFRAVFLARSGRVDEGIASARLAVELDPLHPGAWNNLAVALIQGDRLLEAQEAYESALRVSPEDPVILGNIASLLARQQRFEEAIGFLDRALVRTPEDVQTLALRTSILLRSGPARRDEAMAMLEGLEARPDFPRWRLAILWSNVGDVERILDLLEESVNRREDGALSIRDPQAFNGMRHHPRFVKLLERIG